MKPWELESWGERSNISIIGIRELVITKIKEIQNGSGVNWKNLPENIRGDIFEPFNGLFSLGMEYGYILALVELFDISTEELI